MDAIQSILTYGAILYVVVALTAIAVKSLDDCFETKRAELGPMKSIIIPGLLWPWKLVRELARRWPRSSV